MIGCTAETWPAGPFDVVSCIDVLHHVPPAAQRTFLCEAVARIRPGGKLVFKDMDPRRAIPALQNRLHDLVLARQWIHYADPDRVAGWLAEAGLTVGPARVYSTLGYRHFLLIGERPTA